MLGKQRNGLLIPAIPKRANSSGGSGHEDDDGTCHAPAKEVKWVEDI